MKKILFCLFLLIIILVFRSWIISSGTLSAGDWPYLYAENIREFSWLPDPRFLWLAPYYQIFTKILFQIGLSWEAIERVAWFLPFIVISAFSSYRLTKSLLGALIYTTNTYALMVVGGGQMGVALAYGLAPLILRLLINLIDHPASNGSIKYQILNIKYVFTASIGLATQVMFDPRISAITLVAAVLYALFIVGYKRIVAFIVPVVLTIIVHLYWIVPFLAGGKEFASRLINATADSVQYLSFGSFSQSLSLLHPNWPENIFGKTYFLRPEFLILPIIAFVALLFAKKEPKVYFFALLGLVGVFLAKGANEPFGSVYLWLFDHVPGFVVFRDPTKFYILIAIAYSFLIPWSLKKSKYIFPLVFIAFWTFSIRGAVIGQIGGTFRPMSVPQQYLKLKDFIENDQRSFSTLWVPKRQRFAFSSETHPALEAQELPKNLNELKQNNVKYVIVPFDSRGEIFLTDRKFDENLYREFLDFATSQERLFRVDLFGPIGVFAIK